MATLGKSANLRCLINGKELLFPSELYDLSIKAEFGTEGTQANILIETFTLRGNARTEVLSIINAGLNGGVGIFEGVPLSIEAFNIDTGVSIFDGYLDLADGYIDNDADNSLTVTLKKADGLNNLNDRLDGVTFGNLVDKGIISDSDYTSVEYVAEKPFNIIESLTNAIIVYLLFKELAELLERQIDTTATAGGIAGAGITGVPSSGVFTVIKTIADIAYAITVVALIARLSRQLLNSFLPPKRTHKTLNLFTALSKIAQELGYTFESEQEDFLKRLYYLPSNQNFDESTVEGFVGVAKGTSAGIPNPSDYGYNCGEMVELARQLILGNKSVIGDVFNLSWQGSDYFERQADFRLFDALNKNASFNTDEANRSRLIQFQTDIRDIWTVKQFKGTNYQVLTEPITTNNDKFITLLGAEQISIPVALGNRKDGLNALERTIESILSVFDTIINALGGAFGIDSDFSGIVSSKIGLLKVSDNNHTIPKLLYLEGGKIPSNHRDFLSAKAIYNNYYFWKSFVSNSEKAQKKLFNGVEVPFGLSDFIKVVENAYIYNSNGKSSKLVDLEWKTGKDKATVSYFERGAYTRNLKETFIEQN